MNNDRRRRRFLVLVLAVLLLLGTAVILTDSGTQPPAPAPPGSAEAQTSDPTLSVVQTSTMVGLAPGVAGVPISGQLTNHGADNTFVAHVEVEITSVTAGSDAPDGACEVSDYRVTDSRMAVGRTLEPGGAASFTGASIGFSTATHNQDACQWRDHPPAVHGYPRLIHCESPEEGSRHENPIR